MDSKYSEQETRVLIRLWDANAKIAQLTYPSLTFRIKVEQELLSLIADLKDMGLVKPVKYISNLMNKESVFNKQVYKIMSHIENLFMELGSPIPSTRKKAFNTLKGKGFRFSEISGSKTGDGEIEKGEGEVLQSGQTE